MRLFVLLTSLTAAGVVAARPDAVLPVAGRFIEPLFAQQSEPASKRQFAPVAEIGVALPSFVQAPHDLTFSGVDEESGPGASAISNAPTPSDASVVTGATVKTDAPPNAAATANPVPASKVGTPAAAAANSPPPMAFPAAPQPVATLAAPTQAAAKPPVGEQKAPAIAAKLMFGAAKAPAPLASRAIGAYARGCLAGGVALPVDGPAWQAMRLSRNRNWGHPDLIKLVQRFASDAQKLDGWPGLLVGDISQPRGGPMLTGHASHQVGLDADVWLTPMPQRRLSNREREEMSATSMLDKTDLAVNPRVFTEAHVKLIKRAASYPQVERVLVHPAIKKALCQAAGKDRKWLGKVRPIGGHYYHFHIRIGCPPGFAGCKPQAPPTGDDGCAKEVDEWLARLAPPKTPPPPKPPGYKPPPPKPPITLAQLPPECTVVLASGPDGIKPSVFASSLKATPLPKVSSVYAGAALRPYLKRLQAPAGAN
ncbi:MAG: penicillin-insensitive murein endopeptidase [Hyphomicrobium sp.]